VTCVSDERKNTGHSLLETFVGPCIARNIPVCNNGSSKVVVSMIALVAMYCKAMIAQ
jgi:hypothetical protein